MVAGPVACGEDTSAEGAAGTDAGGAANDNGTGGLGGDTGIEDGTGPTDSATDATTEPADGTATPDDGDAGPAEVKPVCPGGPNCSCTDNKECDNALCLETSAGKKCAQTCTDSCEKGFACKQFGGVDGVFVCVPQTVSLCAPCTTHQQCAFQGAESYCLDYGSDGKFCGAPCKDDKDCAADYECLAQDVGAGKTAKQCKLKAVFLPKGVTDCNANPGTCAVGEVCQDGKCGVKQLGLCQCSTWATAQGLTTECSKTNAAGTCKATRKCGADGLEACSAKDAKPEVCNLEDDNCDGAKDNLAPDFQCAKKAFKPGGSGSACKLDSECNVDPASGKLEACDEKAGKCQLLIGKCPGKPTCAANGDLICQDAKTPKEELCNGEDDDCDNEIDEDFGWPIPNDAKQTVVPMGKACGLGPCVGGKVKCKSISEAYCDTDVKAKKEECDGIDNNCDGLTDNESCDDASFCTKDICEAATGKCTHEPANECDDKDQCTTDSCNPKTGKCIFEPFTGACDDGDKCTVGDSCKKDPKDANGKLVCVPGPDPAKCDDANLCTDDSCEPAKGCVNLANAATQTCYSADAKTKDAGTCHAGTQFCMDAKLLPKCEGEVVPAKTEACDGLDDTCDGKTDEGCKAAAADVTFATATLVGKTKLGNGSEAALVAALGPSAPIGAGANEKYAVWFGFLSWIKGFVK